MGKHNTARFVGVRTDGSVRVRVELKDGTVEELPPRNDLRNHSPDGFEWGYGGSGPAQLALAILAACVETGVAMRLYQNFKLDVVSRFASDSWTMSKDEVMAWIGHAEEQNG